MTAITLLLVAAAIAYGAASLLRVPAPPLLVALGVLLKVSGLLGDGQFISFMLLMGVTMLVFVAGAELNPARFSRQGIAAIKVGLGQFLVLGVGGFGLVYFMGTDPIEAAYVGLALAASSTFVVVRILKKRRQFYEPFGRMVLGVLLIQDVLVILAISALMRWPDGQLAVESALFRTLSLLLVAAIAARTLIPWVLTKLKLDEEAQLIVVFSILFLFIGAAHELQVPLVTGAFCAGFAVSAFPVNSVIRGQLTSFSDFFLALFFTSLGAMLVVPSASTVAVSFVMITAVIVLTPVIVTWLAERSGMTAKSSIESGLLLAQTSEFSLVVVLVASERGQLSDEWIAAVALVTVVTMVLTQITATDANVWRLLKLHPSNFRDSRAVVDVKGHIVILGVGRNAEGLVAELLERNEVVLVVDQDPVVCEWAEATGAIAIRADAADLRVLDIVNAKSAKAVISTLKQMTVNRRIIEDIGDVPAIVRAFEDSEVEAIQSAGGIPIAYSKAAAEDFTSWFDNEFGRDHGPAYPEAPEGN